MLVGVTITGADDYVDPDELAKLSESFPFVEWGFLLSAKRFGSPRYPSMGWLDRMRTRAFPRSLHVCGEVARSACRGEPLPFLCALSLDCGRMQINGFEPYPELVEFLKPRAHVAFEVILQVREANQINVAAKVARECGGRTSLLYDPSGGRGVEQSFWPPAPDGVRMGYAGGINPSNVVDVLIALRARDDFWIDMESGVRTNDRFDLAKVRDVLEKCTPFVLPTRLVQPTTRGEFCTKCDRERPTYIADPCCKHGGYCNWKVYR